MMDSSAQPATTLIQPLKNERCRWTTYGIAWRLFVTCWLVYGLHFATNIVREVYPAVALGDHFTFSLDEYANLHDDLSPGPDGVWRSGNNPGVSFLAAIPYAIVRPGIDLVVDRVLRSRAASGLTEPPAYDSPWPMARDFYAQVWRRGLDVKLGLATLVMQGLCMAPMSALAVVLMFYVLGQVSGSDKTAAWLALLYAFGTPVFFRTGSLNHNLMLGHIAFAGFVAMWNPGASQRWSTATRYFLGGLAGGTAVLFDYSGVVLLMGIFIYGVIKSWRQASFKYAFAHGWMYFLGTLGPICLLWFYQWKCFGNPFLPGQHWMSAREYMDQGYQGFGLPQLGLLISLAIDYRFGIFVSCPIFVLAAAALMFNRGPDRKIPQTELNALLLIFAAFWVFFSCSNYTRLQFNTGIRYMAPMFAFLFVPAAIVLLRLPRVIAIGLISVCVIENWCLAMHRDVERGFGLLDPILHVFWGGFKLPVLTTLSRMGPFHEFFVNGYSALPILLVCSLVIYAIWFLESPWSRLSGHAQTVESSPNA